MLYKCKAEGEGKIVEEGLVLDPQMTSLKAPYIFMHTKNTHTNKNLEEKTIFKRVEQEQEIIPHKTQILLLFIEIKVI